MPEQQAEWEKLHEAGYQRQLMGEWEEARHLYKQSLELNPNYAKAQLSLAQLIMMESGFREGRDLYECRFAASPNENGFDWRVLPLPRWHGETLTDKHLHLWAEQGFGDVIMYAGFLPWILDQKPSRVTISMFPKMMTLFARSFPQIHIESLEDIGSYAASPAIMEAFPKMLQMAGNAGLALNIDLEPMRRDYERAIKRGIPDYSAPMGDLMVYGLPNFVPAQHPAYLKADPDRVIETRKSLQSLGAGRLVGISWHSANKENGHVRSIPLEQWLPVLQIPGCHFISLQHNMITSETERFCNQHHCRIVDPGFDPVQDTEGLAALIASLDEVITIDNSNAHLAGALGVPATLLLPRGCDFRWPVLKNAADTLWYQSINVEKQEKSMDWMDIIRRVSAGLQRRLLSSGSYDL